MLSIQFSNEWIVWLKRGGAVDISSLGNGLLVATTAHQIGLSRRIYTRIINVKFINPHFAIVVCQLRHLEVLLMTLVIAPEWKLSLNQSHAASLQLQMNFF